MYGRRACRTIFRAQLARRVRTTQQLFEPLTSPTTDRGTWMGWGLCRCGWYDRRTVGRTAAGDSAVWAGRSHFRCDAGLRSAISGDGDRRPTSGAATCSVTKLRRHPSPYPRSLSATSGPDITVKHLGIVLERYGTSCDR